MPKADPVHQEIMSGLEFRKWAEFGTEAYGMTPWFFLRELAQNSRDAGAGEIRVSARRDPAGREVLVCADNGSGMGFAHARQYFFRLYSSNKENDPHAAGMYGIGFWTVLHFDPEEISIESRTRREKWGVTIGRDLQVGPCACLLEKPGTRVTLIRRALFTDQETFSSQVRRELQHHCRFLRRNTRRPMPLSVHLEGEKINQLLELPGPLSISFHRGTIEGAVSVGEQPKVLLYAKGLSIWEGSFLEELASPGASEPEAEEVSGVYPVFLLNGNDLKVNLFRREAIADQALKRLVAASRFYLKRLIVRYSRRAFPRRGWAGLYEAVSAAWRRLGWYLANPRRLVIALTLVLACVGVFWLALNLGSRSPAPSILQPRQRIMLGLVSSSQGKVPTKVLTYTPGDDRLFRVHTADLFDAYKGFSGSSAASQGVNITDFSCREQGCRVSLQAEGGQMIVLPCPTGYRIDTHSLALSADGERLPEPSWYSSDVIRLPRRPQITVTYQCCPDDGAFLTGADRAQLTRLPQSTQNGLDRLLAGSSGKAALPGEKLDTAASLLRRLLLYDRSHETLDRYQAQDPSKDWLSRILAVGRGDCDVLNGLMVLLLRRMGVASRLAVGLVGVRGRVTGTLHAWVEYFSDGWHSFDITASIRSASAQAYSPLPADAGQSSGPTGQRKQWPMGMVILGGAALVLLFGILAGIQAARRAEKISSTTPAEIRRGLGQIALQMMQKPQAWGWDRQLWNQRFLPLRDGGLLSLREALLFARNGRLYVACRHNKLADKLPRRGGRILDGDDQDFAGLYRVFPKIIDLDWLAGLDMCFPGQVKGDPLASLLTDLNQLLPRVSSRLPSFLWAPGLKDRHWHHVRLHKNARRRRPEIPFSFVAVNPASAALKPLTRLYAENRRLAIFQVFRTILADVRDEPVDDACRAKLARLLLEDPR